MSRDITEFLWRRTPYLQAPSDWNAYPFRCEKRELCLDPDSIAVLRDMQKGGILLTAHLGNYECMGLWLSRLQIPLIASYHPQRPECLDSFLQRLRSIPGRVYAKIQKPRDVLRCLDEGNLFALLFDQDYRGSARLKSFFLGQPVHCNPLPLFLLRQRPGLPVFFCSLKTEGHRRILFAERIISSSPESFCQYFHSWLEKQISMQPDDWYGFFHRRFHSTINPHFSFSEIPRI